MDTRARWQALQSRLKTARASFERGDRDQALAEVDAALAIDPSFLAAIALRERVVSEPVPIVEDLHVASQPPAASFQPPVPSPELRGPSLEPPAPSPQPTVVFADGYARFEQRARRRRVDRKIEAARLAIARGNLRGAASALDEVIELDPNLPELSTLTAAFDELRRDRATSHRGPMIAAAATFGIVLLGATWFRDARVLLSHPVATIAGLVEPIDPEPIEAAAVDASTDSDLALPTATTGRDEVVAPAAVERPQANAASTATAAVVPPQSAPVLPASAPVSPSSAPSVTSSFAPAPLPNVPPPAPAPIASPPAAAAPVPSTSVAAASASPAPAAAVDVPKPTLPAPSRVENDEAQIALALQQYRSAYEGLDAKRARAIWPAVNESALARAFESLESQRLTFEACRTQLNGDNAVATCEGTARYVPKIGSREPRVEPRTWTFILRRADGDWKIETARAER